MARALVVGASGGIGAAFGTEMDRRGYEVLRLSRSDAGLEVTDEASVAAALEATEGPLRLVFVATGALVIDCHEPERAVRKVTGKGFCIRYGSTRWGQFWCSSMRCDFCRRERRRCLPLSRHASARSGTTE